MKLNSVELFAGAGGLGLGIAEAGFEHRLVVEFNKDACQTLRSNFGITTKDAHAWPLYEGDVCLLDFKDLEGKIDLVSGGPPCQPFSIGGKHQGFRDRRDMFPEVARVVRTVKPRAFFFENVKGLLRESFAKYFQYILLQLKYPEIARKDLEKWTGHLSRLEQYHTRGQCNGLYYRVLFRLVNAADYGVPQKRERVVIVGFRSDICEDWCFPEPAYSEDELLRAQFVSGEYWEKHKVAKQNRPESPKISNNCLARLRKSPQRTRPWITIRDAIFDLPDPRSVKASLISNHKFQAGAKAYKGHTGSPLDEPSKTLKAGDHGVPGGENMFISPDGSVRYFTIREAARVQTFPDWFNFNCPWTESMRQIGNAVPVKLANVIAKSIHEKLKHAQSQKD